MTHYHAIDKCPNVAFMKFEIGKLGEVFLEESSWWIVAHPSVTRKCTKFWLLLYWR